MMAIAGNTKPSMLQDLEQGRATEVDVVNGGVAERGRAHSIATPFNDRVVELVHAMERRRALAGSRRAHASSSLTPARDRPRRGRSADALLAAQPALQERPGALDEIRERIAARDGRLLVIDDDPTGTQSVHGVPVLTAWSEDDLAAALRDAGTVFVLTNSRSQPEREAVAVNREITGRAAAIAAAEGYALAVASRSDSTMRGHFPQEPDAVAEALGTPVDGVLLCPCFLEAGR